MKTCYSLVVQLFFFSVHVYALCLIDLLQLQGWHSIQDCLIHHNHIQPWHSIQDFIIHHDITFRIQEIFCEPYFWNPPVDPTCHPASATSSHHSNLFKGPFQHVALLPWLHLQVSARRESTLPLNPTSETHLWTPPVDPTCHPASATSSHNTLGLFKGPFQHVALLPWLHLQVSARRKIVIIAPNLWPPLINHNKATSSPHLCNQILKVPKTLSRVNCDINVSLKYFLRYFHIYYFLKNTYLFLHVCT